MFCENCGSQIPDSSAFCEECGAKMAADDRGAGADDRGDSGLAREFSYSMGDYGPCGGPISDELLVRALRHVEESEGNFFALTEKATGRFLQTAGHCRVEASPAKGKIYSRNFGSFSEVAEVFMRFLLFAQFPDISGWDSVKF